MTPSPSLAAPTTPTVVAQAEQTVTVDIVQPTPSVTPDDPLRANVAVSVTAPAEYLEVRLRLFGPSGRLVYQKTEIRSEMPAGRHVVGFEHDLAPLDLTPGRYPIEVRVLATGSTPTAQAGRLLVVPADAEVLPVALVVHISNTPAVAADGRFTRDPSTDTALRDDIAYLTQLALDRRTPLALAIAPVLIEQVARAAGGFETVDGSVAGPDSEIVGRYAQALEDLRSAITTGAVGLISVPYALPDADGIRALDAADDLSAHWALTDTVSATALGSAQPLPIAFTGAFPSADSLAALRDRDATAVLLAPEALRSGEDSSTPGCHSVRGSSLRLLAVDTEVARATSAGADAFYDALFDRLGSDEPVVVMLEVGPGAPNTAAEAQRALDWIAGADWLRATDVVTAASSATPSPASLGPRPSSSVPPLYWASVAEGRDAERAYSSAVGAGDAEATAMRTAILTAESALWAGADGRWTAAAEGIELATGVRDYVSGQFDTVRIDARDVTLSASRGNVPLALTNGTGKQLELTLTASSERIRLPDPESKVTIQPADNFVTVPVDLGTIIVDDMRVTVLAGDMPIAETTVRVRASHLDRLAAVGMVVVVLVGLLFFIRRRVRAAIAGTIAVTEPDE
ncbi:MAG: hypothetical protein Q7W44_02875 [Coriobacteriia bacterium]|nr:hypothetical protein [Coriobacteriia bacterium]